MTARPLILAAATPALAPAAAAAQPTTIYIGEAWRAGPAATPGGGAFTPWNPSFVGLADRDGDGFATAKTAFRAPEFEQVWGAGLDARGAGVVITVRKHKPYQ